MSAYSSVKEKKITVSTLTKTLCLFVRNRPFTQKFISESTYSTLVHEHSLNTLAATVSALLMTQREHTSITYQWLFQCDLMSVLLRFECAFPTHHHNSTSSRSFLTHIKAHVASELTLTQMIKRRWPRLCWYIKQHEQRNMCNSHEEALVPLCHY